MKVIKCDVVSHSIPFQNPNKDMLNTFFKGYFF